MIAKAGLGLIGLSAIGIGGVAVAKPHLLGMDYMPEFHALSKDSDFSTAGYTDKLGNKFKNYLVGVTTKNGDNKKTNQGWWDWAVRKLNKEKTKPKKFENVKIGYSAQDNNNEALNQVCKQAYKESDSTGFGTTSSEDKFTKADVWKYCSPLGKEPTKIKDNDYGGKIGESIKSEAISVKDTENEMFWSIREKEVQGKDDNFTKVPSTDISSTHFSNRGLPMKELCKQAYETQTGSSGGTPNAEDTKKYCKFEIAEA